ncbi:hypothetical protein CARUB_v10005563mg [Capsella rubella]|uniref:Uncharacterized protein n=1 Tax=Capsella rubella TaxID=81985 RepID=R0F6V5_9BRAS|nr:uncharacterized protein LOC17877426 [Capsella rubella]XP_023634844.1 uncharacterized protein LOC17877426 [Capsella rubella]EOA17291.1 hypothetical protein CARUB_v10005563mg [Capsella rubella]
MGKRGAKKLTNTQGGPNLKSVLRHEHLKNLALWSSAGDTPIPSLASLFGRCLAADIETTGIAPDPDLVSCQRCETILKPGFNCNVRIEKVSAKQKKRTRCKKSNICLPQNNVVYHCNFCSHRNLKRGTAKGQMKEIYPFKPKAPRPTRPKINKETTTVPQEIQSNMLSSPVRSEKDQVEEENGVANTPKPMMLTLDRGKRIRKSKSKKPVEPESVAEKTVGGSNKRKRNSWTSVKEIAETNKSSRTNFKIPFLL